MNFTFTEDVIKKRIEDEQIYQQVLQVFYILFFLFAMEKVNWDVKNAQALHFYYFNKESDLFEKSFRGAFKKLFLEGIMDKRRGGKIGLIPSIFFSFQLIINQTPIKKLKV